MSNFEQHQVQTGSRNSTQTGCFHLTLFSEVGRRQFEHSRTWNAQNIAVALEIASIFVSISNLLVLPVCTWWSLPESYDVDRCRWKWIGFARKHYRSRWDHFDIVFRHQIILLPVSVRYLELELQREWSIGLGWHINQWTTAPKNIGV